MIKKMIQEHPFMMIIITILSISTNGLETVANLILITATNTIISRKTALFFILSGAILLVYLIHWFTGYYANIFEEKMIQATNHDIRKKIHEKSNDIGFRG